MPSITIDGKTCEFDGRQTILQVALDNGVAIPHYCYHPGLSVVASCRICLAEVAQPDPRKDNELSLIPKLVPTCQTPAVDGAEVYLQSDKSRANQQAVMEYLLINHPLDCPVCDQAGECHLQDYSYEYGRGHSRFEEAKIKQPKKDIGPNVWLYSDRCIMCTRCVRFTREVTGTSEICVNGRGNTEEIDVFPGKALDNPLSANVVDICPVGALLDKDFLFSQRVWFLTSTPSIDGLTASGDNIFIEHNEGRVYRIKPRANADVNQWWISDEIRYSWKSVHHEDRLLNPLIQQDGQPTESEWSVAYERALAGLRDAADNGKRLAAMISPMLSCEEAFALAQFVRGVDDRAVLGVGPIPADGQDQTFPGGYTIYAEKAPNARGVRRVLEQIAGQGNVPDYASLLGRLNSDEVGAVLLTGNYPQSCIDEKLTAAASGKFTVSIDIWPAALAGTADVTLPGATWAEKSGTFESIQGRLQTFEPAITVLELARAEGRIATDLMVLAGLADPGRFDAAQIRAKLGGVFVTDVHQPGPELQRTADMQYVEI